MKARDIPPETRWEEAVALFHDAVAVPRDERAALLAARCGEDDVLREEVESLLGAHDLAGGDLSAVTATVAELSTEALELVPGRRLGPYTVLRELGAGGMSRVFLAARSDDQFDRFVAIKMLRTAVASGAQYERFRVERQVLADLEHACIARLYEGGASEAGYPYIVMEYVAGGRHLDDYCELEGVAIPERLALFRSVCEAVGYAHRNLVVHRDLKPSNILVTGDGSVKLVDFGISKLLAADVFDVTVTQDAVRAMTPSYASPEQILGEATTTATDIFSLGVVLFRLLTGSMPYGLSISERVAGLAEGQEALSPSAMARMQPTALGQGFLRLPRGRREDLDAIVLECLRREPTERYASVAQLVEDLDRWKSFRAVQARHGSWAYRVSRTVRRHRLPVSLAALAIGSLVVGVSGLSIQTNRLAIQRDLAERKAAESEKLLGLMVDLFGEADPASSRGEDLTVKEALRQAEPRIVADLADQPVLRATLLDRMAEIYFNLGWVGDTERALQLAEGDFVPGSDEELDHLELRAIVLGHNGQNEESLRLRQWILAERLARGDDALDVARGLVAVAVSCDALARFEEAESYSRRALASLASVEGEGVPLAVAEAHFSLGQSLVKRHLMGEGLEVFRRGLEGVRGALGSDHPVTLRFLIRLAVLRMEDPDGLDEAEDFTRQVLSAQGRLYDGDHPALAVTLDTLGNILRKQGRLAGARRYLEQSIEMNHRLSGEESVAAAISLTNLGWLELFAAGDAVRAIPLFQRSLELEGKFYPADAPILSYPLVGLGRALSLSGRAAEGESLLRRAVRVREAAYASDDLEVAEARAFLADCLIDLGRLDEALAVLEQARRELGEQAPPPELEAALRRMAGIIPSGEAEELSTVP